MHPVVSGRLSSESSRGELVQSTLASRENIIGSRRSVIKRSASTLLSVDAFLLPWIVMPGNKAALDRGVPESSRFLNGARERHGEEERRTQSNPIQARQQQFHGSSSTNPLPCPSVWTRLLLALFLFLSIHLASRLSLLLSP